MKTNRLVFVLMSLLGQFLQTKAFTAAPCVGVRKIRVPCNHHDRPTASALPAANVQTIGKGGSNVAVAGKLFPIIKSFFIGPEKANKMWSSVVGAIDPADLLLIVFFGWVLPPVSKLIYNRSHRGDDSIPVFTVRRLHKIVLTLSQIAKIFGIVYIIDLLAISLDVIGIKFPYQHNFSKKCAEALFTLYAAWRLVPYKQYLIKKRVMRTSGDEAKTKIKIYDSLFNIAIAVTTVFILLDELKIPIGRALQSVFAIGGVGTLVFSLASKDLASQIINGVALVSSNKCDEGDYILLGDGTIGTVCNIGWVSTDLRGGDEVVVKIPNSQLANQRMSNLSRLKRSQVKQQLWFAYEDLDKLPTVIENIKTEIGASCSSLITDGSRPFRVVWSDYRDDHLEVSVDCRFRHPPSTDEYFNTRQNVLLAISRAAKKAGVEFSIPNVRVKTSKRESSGGNLQQQYGMEDQATRRNGPDTDSPS